MGEYFAKIKRVADNLVAVGQPISNDDKMMYLLAGLGSNYDPVVIPPFLKILEEVREVVAIEEDEAQSQNSQISASIDSPEMVVDPAWYVDSGATNHVTNELGRMQAATEYLGNQKLTVGSGQGLPIQHIGHSFLLPFQG
ncbi:hypothetical protein CK203_111920 [Vitis vinifera]|uniref:Uncharacterized protein n=1 Tax=Vitis vinifera TaxID=29760 RepID=A0A438CFS3_VITVI|nr:hypothetical protein CK203_111920 [Vitis vinifera]